MNTRDWKVMRTQCATCPFRINAYGRHNDPALVTKIQARCLSEASQICHHPRLKGRRETRLCRGARNFQLAIFHRIGFLVAPTDAAWDAIISKGK